MALTGLIAVTISFIRDITFQRISFIETLHDPSVSVDFLFSLIILITRKLESRFIQHFQIMILLIHAAFTLMKSFESIYGMGFIFLTIMLAHRYGFLTKHAKIKFAFISLFTLFFLEFSVYRSGDDRMNSSINILVHLVFFLAILYLIFMEDRNWMLKIERLFQVRMTSMEEEKVKLIDQVANKEIELHLMEDIIEDLERQIEDSPKALDFIEYRITRREQDLIREFCTNPHLTTKELAFNLNMSAGTVKQHFTSIFRKLKIRNRPELLDKCKGNFK